MIITTKANANSLPEKKEFITVPEGKYLAKIARIKDKESLNTGSKMVAVNFEVTMGPQTGNAIFDNFLYDNTSQRGIEVGTDRARKLGKMLGMDINHPTDLLKNEESFLGQNIIIHVKHSKSKEGNKLFANISKFEPGL